MTSMASSVAKRFIPLMDRVLVQKVTPPAQTKSGLFLPGANKVSSNLAKVLAVGSGRLSRDGTRIPIDLKEGDTVIVPEYGGVPLKLDETDFHVFRDEDIIGIVNE